MPPLELVPLTDHASYVAAPTAIGVVRNGKRAALVDSGLDENLVRKVLNHLKDEGVTVEAVVTTHAHADHFGGNAFALQRTPAEVWAPAGEHHFMEAPGLEPHTLYGAHPPTGLQSKWLQAAPSAVHHAVAMPEGRAEVEILGLKWRFHALPGHSVNQAAVEVDGACFLSDALIPEATLRKYGIVFAVDPGAQRESAERIPRIGASVYQTYHGGTVEDLGALVAANVASIDRYRDLILGFVRDGPVSSEEAFRRLSEHEGWELSLAQYHLNFATVRGYLARLERDGLAAPRVEGGRLEWVAMA